MALIFAKNADGTNPIARVETFTADGTTTDFNFTLLSASDVTQVAVLNNEAIYGDVVDPSNYTLDTGNNKITFNTAPGLYTLNYTATGGETTLQITKQPFVQVNSITKNATTLTETTDYTVDSTGLITFVTALSASDAIVVDYVVADVIMCQTDGGAIFDEYGVISSSPYEADRTIVQPIYVVETGVQAFNSVSVDVVDTVSGAGATKDWVTLSLDNTTYQAPPLSLGSISTSGSAQTYIKVIVPQNALSTNIEDLLFTIKGIAVS